jgi:hypothetical protein
MADKYAELVGDMKRGDSEAARSLIDSMGLKERSTTLNQLAKNANVGGKTPDGCPPVELVSSAQGNITKVIVHADGSSGTMWEEGMIQKAGRVIGEDYLPNPALSKQ